MLQEERTAAGCSQLLSLCHFCVWFWAGVTTHDSAYCIIISFSTELCIRAFFVILMLRRSLEVAQSRLQKQIV